MIYLLVALGIVALLVLVCTGIVIYATAKLLEAEDEFRDDMEYPYCPKIPDRLSENS